MMWGASPPLPKCQRQPAHSRPKFPSASARGRLNFGLRSVCTLYIANPQKDIHIGGAAGTLLVLDESGDGTVVAVGGRTENAGGFHDIICAKEHFKHTSGAAVPAHVRAACRRGEGGRRGLPGCSSSVRTTPSKTVCECRRRPSRR